MNNFQVESSSKSSPGVGARILASLFFLFFVGMGLVFVWLISREAYVGLKTWTWNRKPCEIISSEVRQRDRDGRQTGDYYFEVRYQYDFSGHRYTSDRYGLKAPAFQDYSKAGRLTDLYRAESRAVCFVNPSAPNEAVLRRGSLFMPLLVLFPMVFVAIGVLGIYSMWRPQLATGDKQKAISDRAVRPPGRTIGVCFFMIFVLVGSGCFYAFFVLPLFKMLSARQWPSVPCVVISSEVRRHSGDHGSTYSVNILYSYEFNGREFKANRYNFIGGSSSGSNRKYAIVAKYPPASRSFCYVNPADPTEAVLERGFTPAMWIGLIPLVFVLVGLAGVRGMLRGKYALGLSSKDIATSKKASPISGTLPESCLAQINEPLLLKPSVPPLGKLIAACIFALFWNGIVSVFGINIIRHWSSGPFEWFLALFMVPFVLIGLGIIVAAIYFFLALFNPRPHLTITPGAVPLGGRFRIEWELRGRLEVLERLRVRLVGREEATYQSGKNTATDKNVFADIEIADITYSQEMRSGSSIVTVPAHLMHCFQGGHNKVIWALRVQGEIPRWPDLDEEFPISILPAARSCT